MVQLGFVPVASHQSDYSPAVAGVASKSCLGVAGAVLAGVVFLLVCCLVAGSRDNENK